MENITPDVVEEITAEEWAEPAEVNDEPVENEEAEASESQEEQVEEVIERLKLVYNGEEKEVTLEEAKTLAQKGMNYDKILSKLDEAKNDPLRKWAESFMEKNGFKTPDEFLEAIAKEEEERKLNELVSKNIPREYAEKLLEVDKIKAQLEQKDKQEKETKEFSDFLDWHESKVKSGVFQESLDVKSIPEQVWEATKAGASLKEAYMDYALSEVRTKTEQATIDKLSKNAQTTPGSVNKNSKSEDTPMSSEQIAQLLSQMTPDDQRKWIRSNYDKVEKAGFFS